MSMHLVGPELSLNRIKKYKLKLTKQKRHDLECDLAEYNKQRKRNGEPKITFDEYLDMRCGIVKSKPIRPNQMGTYNGPRYSPPPGRETPYYPSLNSGIGVALKKEPQHYTGTNMLGIGQLHKSNSVPVFRKEDAEDQAKMRRG